MDFDEFAAKPEAHGLPSFSEFCKNPEKFLGRPDDIFICLDNIKSALQTRFKKDAIKYELFGYRTTRVEELQRMCQEMGLNPKDLDFTAHLIPQGGGSTDVLVKILSKSERARRDSWG